MLWKIEQIDIRRDEIKEELKTLVRTTGISSAKRKTKLEELGREDTQLYVQRGKLQSLVNQDPQLSRMQDRRIEEHQKKALEPKPLPEAQRGLAETKSALPPAASRDAMRAHVKTWKEKTPAEREIAQSKLLESEREPD